VRSQDEKLEEPNIGPAGIVTFANFTCQPRCTFKDRTEENQSFGALDVGAKSTENGLFLASVTTPGRRLPPRLAGGISGPTRAHSWSVRSLG